MKKLMLLSAATILAVATFKTSAAFAFTTDQGNDPVLSTGVPHLTDPDEQTGAQFGGGSSEPSSYFTSGGGSATGSNAGSSVDSKMYNSGYSIRPEKDANTARPMANQ